MIDAHGIKQIIETEMTYKPGYKFKACLSPEVGLRGEEWIRVDLIFKVEDVGGHKPGLNEVIHTNSIHCMHFDTRDDVIRYMRDRIHDAERHEADEWFKVNGIAPYYPHEV